MADNPGTNVPVYFSPGEEDFLEDFDDIASEFQDRRRYSRSAAIREAMELYVTVLETMDEMDWPKSSPRGRRASVRQALLTEDRRERE